MNTQTTRMGVDIGGTYRFNKTSEMCLSIPLIDMVETDAYAEVAARDHKMNDTDIQDVLTSVAKRENVT